MGEGLGERLSNPLNPMTESSESSFIPVDQPSEYEEVRLDIESRTQTYYKVYIDGHYYFKKALRPEYLHKEYYREMMRKEYELGSQLQSGYVVRYVQLTDTPDKCYVLMDYVSGTTLSEFLLFHPDYFRQGAHLHKFLVQICQALQEVHAKQALHLDLKPSNIMLTGVNMDVRLIDLGCSYMDSRLATTGHTNRFAAPEQLNGSHELDARTDIYALGRVLIEMGGARLPSPYRGIADRCTREHKDDRYRSVDEILEVLSRSARRLWIVAAVLALLALIGAGTYYHHATAEYVLRDSLFCYGRSDDMLRLRVRSVEERTAAVVSPPPGQVYHADLIIPDSVVHEGRVYYVTELADSAFLHSTELTGVKFPSCLTTIGRDAFNGCTQLHALHFPASMRQVMMAAFVDCNSLTHISWASSVEEVPRNAFLACKKIRSITLPEGVTTIRQDAFCDCASLEEISLPSSLTKIERGAFFLCNSLRRITLPEHISSLGEYLFYKCYNLEEIRVLAPVPPYMSTIIDKNFRGIVRVPAASLDAYRHAPGWQHLPLAPM